MSSPASRRPPLRSSVYSAVNTLESCRRGFVGCVVLPQRGRLTHLLSGASCPRPMLPTTALYVQMAADPLSGPVGYVVLPQRGRLTHLLSGVSRPCPMRPTTTLYVQMASDPLSGQCGNSARWDPWRGLQVAGVSTPTQYSLNWTYPLCRPRLSSLGHLSRSPEGIPHSGHRPLTLPVSWYPQLVHRPSFRQVRNIKYRLACISRRVNR